MENTDTNSQEFLKSMSADDFLQLGTDTLGYMKPVIVEDRPGYALYNANGKLLAVQHGINEIISLAHDHNLLPAKLN